MKATGIVRKIDNLGRLVLPKELRKTMNIDIKDPMEIYVDNDKIILKKYQPACIFCGSSDNTIEYQGRIICKDCLDKIVSKKESA